MSRAPVDGRQSPFDVAAADVVTHVFGSSITGGAAVEFCDTRIIIPRWPILILETHNQARRRLPCSALSAEPNIGKVSSGALTVTFHWSINYRRIVALRIVGGARNPITRNWSCFGPFPR